jgi:protein-export membrane protein SecD
MDSKDFAWLIAIIAIVAAGIWMALNPNYPIQQGLDLQGGLQVLLEADVPEEEPITADQMNTARQIISQRINGLGVSEPLVTTEGDRRILIELPGIGNAQDALSLIQETALLEFVDTGNQPLPEGMCIRTTLNEGRPSRCELSSADASEDEIVNPAPEYPTVMTGAALQSAGTETNSFNSYFVTFLLTSEGGEVFGEHTRTHQGQFLTIVLDKRVISSPRINATIEDAGTITGNFTLEEARNLALQLRFGSLPIPLRIESTRQVGATLGELSIEASVRAGSIGLIVILLFMLVYYRLPGFLADLALLSYALINFAIFKGIGVTLTLPAITGFLLSTGMAVDANILVFERMKEELRDGATLHQAIIEGFSRAWSSIRDSNIATLVICFILFTFGRNFGASVVTGFAITLAIGVISSMFTAVIVTRTFVRIVMGRMADWLHKRPWLLGV